ncbi:MAG: hypothetical protein J0H82_26070 [Alphaproteobacteria bacterium]|nr:hypothetical protein [Alphaproteobacteria bacterium]
MKTPADIDFRMLVDAVTGAAIGGLVADGPFHQVAERLANSAAAIGVDILVAHDLHLFAHLQDHDPGRGTFSAMLNPQFQPTASPDDTVIIGLERGGDLLATYCARRKFVVGDLAAAIGSGRLIYEDPAAMPAGERWVCHAPAGRRIADCHIAVGMGIWADQAACGRDRRLVPLLARALIAYATLEWQWSWFLGFSSIRPARAHAFEHYGADAVEFGVDINQRGRDFRTRLVYASNSRYRALLAHPDFVVLSVDLDTMPTTRAG